MDKQELWQRLSEPTDMFHGCDNCTQTHIPDTHPCDECYNDWCDNRRKGNIKYIPIHWKWNGQNL